MQKTPKKSVESEMLADACISLSAASGQSAATNKKTYLHNCNEMQINLKKATKTFDKNRSINL